MLLNTRHNGSTAEKEDAAAVVQRKHRKGAEDENLKIMTYNYYYYHKNINYIVLPLIIL